MVKYIFITGGVLSGLGKGVVTASTGLILRSMGFTVTAIKIDPYVNVDAGTMNPYMHGEIFVTEDGGETDLDIGHYERFLNTNLTKKHNITTGKIFYEVISKERKGEYLGKCVQIVPHITDEIKKSIRSVAKETDVEIVLVEIGGTVGDIESLPFLEAIRQMRIEEGFWNTAYIHVALAPELHTGEQKTKPVQHSVNELRRIGIQPDAIIVRSRRLLEDENKAKIAMHSTLPNEAIFSVPYVESIYEIPLKLVDEGYDKYIANKLRIEYRKPDLISWIDFVNRVKNPGRAVKLGMIGKYTKVKDSYLSIIEAFIHAGASLNVKPEFVWFESTDIEDGKVSLEELDGLNGLVILPGFGKRGSEGKIKAIQYGREKGLPILGICFGMQLMVIEYARNVIGLDKANSLELDPSTPHPVIKLAEGVNLEQLGGTMRLGSLPIKIVKGTIAWEIYGREIVYERHRHRYVVNNEYVDLLVDNGLVVSGWSMDNYVEFIELKNYKTIFFGTQAHPEYKSRPLDPSPVYLYYLSKITGFK
ncbi:MAG: CTP synthase [Desulfurococcaceae archaeon]